MYEFIRGSVAVIGENYIALDVGGVGYKVFVPERTRGSVKKDQQMTLHTRLTVKDGEPTLYGFADQREREMFIRLTAISGVGPKAAMSVLSSLRVDDIVRGVISADAKLFGKVSGIGPKTAGRIVLELKDKVDLADTLESGFVAEAAAGGPMSEAVEALVSLGYAKAEALAAVSAVKDLGDTAEELTLMALKRMGM